MDLSSYTIFPGNEKTFDLKHNMCGQTIDYVGSAQISDILTSITKHSVRCRQESPK